MNDIVTREMERDPVRGGRRLKKGGAILPERLITAPRSSGAVYDACSASRREGFLGNISMEDPNPDEDGDTFVASFDPLRGFVPVSEIPFTADDDRDEDEEGIEQRRPGGKVSTWAPLPAWQHVQKRVASVPVVNRNAVKAELTRKAEAARRAAPEAKPEPPKGNGNGRKSAVAPPVGKFLAGVVVDQGHKGLLVGIGNGLTARVPIADERGHGSWDAAAAWVLGFKPGAKVRVKVVRVLVNGHAIIEAVLSDRHPRPFWKKEANGQTEARPAN